ncbi:MAG: hypothetical protein MR779_03225 [Tenericutes bacterium]|nr:hypothetical protein [Mycoplasmatota bacterium]
MSEELESYFNLRASQNKISHAFLLYNSNYDSLKESLFSVISKYIFKDEVNEESCDVLIVRPENSKIIKDQILDIQSKFKTKSQFHIAKTYIIDEAQMMNDYAANSLLKFLEEPEDNIYAFLITSNINSVLPTIKSRCQLIKVDDNVDFDIKKFDNELILKSIDLVNKIENYKEDSIAYLPDIFSKKEEKVVVMSIIKIIKYFYYDVLNYKIQNTIQYFDEYSSTVEKIALNINEEDLTRKLIVLNKNENVLKYNVNVNLFIDKLIFDMVGEIYE